MATRLESRPRQYPRLSALPLSQGGQVVGPLANRRPARHFYAVFTAPPTVCAHFLRPPSQNQTPVLMQELSMDVIWMAALAALWVVMAEAVVLLGKYGPAKGELS